jgi:hypothetical protein
MPEGSWGSVWAVIAKLNRDPKADVRSEVKGKGWRREIYDFTPQAEFIYTSLEVGNTVGTTTVLLNNMFRHPRRLRDISYSSVARFVNLSPVIVIARRKTRKSGKDDEGTTWAQARLAFAMQLVEQIEVGECSPEERATRGSVFPPLYLHAIAWWDEHHKKVILGHTSKNEARIYRDKDGKAAIPTDGGELPPEHPTVSAKYLSEARMLFGVAMVKDADGILHGKKAEPFGYTGCQILGIPAYNRACKDEMRRVTELKGKVRMRN